MKPSTDKTELPFARAYDFIMRDKRLAAAEKLVMIEICRYWPSPYYGSASTVAQNTGLQKRYVRKLIKGLCQGREKRKSLGKPQRKAYLKRGYEHLKKGNDRFTLRVIVPRCFPTENEGGTIGPGGGTIGPEKRNHWTTRPEP